MNRIKFILIATIALLYSSHILVAQSHTDTNYIDTNYYRYTYTPLCDFILCKHRNVTFFAMDYIYDTCVNMCPKDGFGLTEYDTIHGIVANPIDCPWVGTAVIPEFQYHMLKLPDGGTDVYGVAVFISSLRNFSPGSYIRFFACRKADDGSHFEKIDSVDLTTNTIGVRRFMRYPILKNEARNVLYHPHLVEPFEECNDRIFDAQVLELYFDQPFHIADSQIFFKIEQHIPRGYFIYSLRTNKHISKTYFYDSNCNLSSTRYYLDIIMAITEPLPEWEHDKLEVLLQNDTEQPDPDPEEPTGENSIALTGNAQWLHIYPNPAKDWLYVESDAPISGLTLCDMTGHAYQVLSNCGEKTSVNISTLRKGIYLLKVTTPNGTAIKKVAVN